MIRFFDLGSKLDEVLRDLYFFVLRVLVGSGILLGREIGFSLGMLLISI